MSGPKKIYLLLSTRKNVLSNLTYTQCHHYTVTTEQLDDSVCYVTKRDYELALATLRSLKSGDLPLSAIGAVLRKLGEE